MIRLELFEPSRLAEDRLSVTLLNERREMPGRELRHAHLLERGGFRNQFRELIRDADHGPVPLLSLLGHERSLRTYSHVNLPSLCAESLSRSRWAPSPYSYPMLARQATAVKADRQEKVFLLALLTSQRSYVILRVERGRVGPAEGGFERRRAMRFATPAQIEAAKERLARREAAVVADSGGIQMATRREKYEVLVSKKWVTVPRAYEQNNGWLCYELWDDDGFGERSVTQSVAQPGKWRTKTETIKGN